MAVIADVSPADVNALFADLTARATADLRQDGFPPEQIRIELALDMRYAGQGYEITVPCGAEPVTTESLRMLRQRFDQQHKAMFGHMAPDEPVEIVSYRVRGVGAVPHVDMPKFAATGATLADARRETRTVRFDGADVDCPVYQRERIDVGLTIEGPAILDQFDCTTVIHPGQAARVDAWKNLIITQES
jgi:N-methylhydantoinase A